MGEGGGRGNDVMVLLVATVVIFVLVGVLFDRKRGRDCGTEGFELGF